ncbi:MAG: rhamnulose-1-phosphate aldolase [Brevinema sp.]
MYWTELPIVQDTIRTLRDMWKNGWDERNSGNISLNLTEHDFTAVEGMQKDAPWQDLNMDISSLANQIFLVSGSGQYFRQAKLLSRKVLGIIKIDSEGKKFQVLAGFEGSRPTSELPTHLLNHSIRNPKGDKVVIHCHPTSTLVLSAVLPLDEKTWSFALWTACTESIVVFPEGIGILPWMLCGSLEIGQVTAEKMKEFRIVLWSHHGVFAMGKDLEETFGLIETVEKSAQVHSEILKLGGAKQIIGAKNLQTLADTFNVTIKKEFLNP